MKRILCTILFCLLMFHAGQARATTALTSGTVVSGSISAGGSVSYTFSGTSGQGAYFTAYSSAFTPVIAIYKPDTTLWNYYSWNFNAEPLPATGTFTVVVKGTYGTDAGSFNLYYVAGGGAVSNGVVSSGQPANASLPKNGMISYQFNGTAGQGVYLYGGASYSSYILLYKPDGTYYTYNGDRLIVTSLPTSGIYTVVILGYLHTDSGPYNFYYVEGGGTVSEGTLISTHLRNGTLSDTLTYPNALTSYQFTGSSGNNLTISSTGSFTRVISLFYPNGDYWTYSRKYLLREPDGDRPIYAGRFRILHDGHGSLHNHADNATHNGCHVR